MITNRREFLGFAAALTAVGANGRMARAQNYPNHPVRIISGFPPGGINDTYARLIAQWLSQHLGQQFFVENRPGAGGTLAAEAVAKSAPDGYMFLLTTSADAWNASLYDKLNFNIVRDFVPVATIARGPGVLVVHPSLPEIECSRTDRLHEEQSRQSHGGLGRDRQRAAYVLGTVSKRDRSRHGACPVPRRRTSGD